MEVLSQLESDYTQALKTKDELAVLVLRQLKTALKNAEITKSRAELTDEEVTKLLRSEVKKRKESAALYEQGGRAELAEKENKEILVISKYLPPELGEDDIRKKVLEVIGYLGAAGPGDTGKVMGAVMKEFGGQADGSVVSWLVKEELGKLSS